MLSRNTGVFTNGKSLLFLKLNNIPLCVYIHTYICVCINLCACVCMENMFFILSSIGGCLCCFHVLNIMNNAAKNIPLKHQFQFFGFCIQYGLNVFPKGHVLETRSLLEQCRELLSQEQICYSVLFSSQLLSSNSSFYYRAKASQMRIPRPESHKETLRNQTLD